MPFACYIQKVKNKIKAPEGTELFLETVAEHRALLVLRGKGLTDQVSDTDPQQLGVEPLAPDRKQFAGSKTAEMVKEILAQVREILKDEEKANFILARGFAQLPDWPMFTERYQVHPAAVAGYPMYRGVARLVGIPVFSQPTKAEDICRETIKAMEEHTFIFSHFKYTDKTGEDGDLDAKVKVI